MEEMERVLNEEDFNSLKCKRFKSLKYDFSDSKQTKIVSYFFFKSLKIISMFF